MDGIHHKDQCKITSNNKCTSSCIRCIIRKPISDLSWPNGKTLTGLMALFKEWLTTRVIHCCWFYPGYYSRCLTKWYGVHHGFRTVGDVRWNEVHRCHYRTKYDKVMYGSNIILKGSFSDSSVIIFKTCFIRSEKIIPILLYENWDFGIRRKNIIVLITVGPSEVLDIEYVSFRWYEQNSG